MPLGAGRTLRRSREPQEGGLPTGGGAWADPEARAVGLLPAPPRHARTGKGGRRRGARSELRTLGPAAWARSRVERLVDRLLPDGALAHRSGRERPVPRPLPERGAVGAPGHRPRL